MLKIRFRSHRATGMSSTARSFSARALALISIATLLSDVSESVSLSDFICQRKPDKCTKTPNSVELSRQHFISDRHRHIPTDFSSWDDYGKTIPDGTGYGPGIGPNYGPGLGEVDVRTGIGVQYPFGSFGYRRDLEVGFGGSGRIGGQTIGFGEGYGNNGDASGLPGWPHSPPFLG
ncbi:hypothetical protein L596_002927 [Steinernema carpocapsae]|uniref:Uncharacterized protein n=1 Tax=Steinernema carpocapsae TaxID=34508 RepID=A0A4U8UTQ7_STECR|nr:hypothetical protein L596_002927 [Steinernema carpocapsae]